MSTRTIRYSFYFLWIVISIIQAAYTELFNDEAYYWKFSQHPDLGYFDHPPIIGLLIRLGFLITGLQNEFSVRLLMIVMNAGTIYLIEKIVRPENLRLFYALISSAIFLHIGFLAIPDTPLLFFTALFFFQFAAYLEKEGGYKTILILSLAISLLLYSKYHGIIIIFFSVISNPEILKRRSFYSILLVSVLLYMPHIYWQYRNNFVTFNYHLFDRSLTEYTVSNTLDYLFTQMFLLGGISTVLLLYFCFRYKTRSAIEKALKWNLAGVLIFFLVMTFKGRVESNWTSVALIPMFALSFRHMQATGYACSNLIYKLSAVSIVIILLVRTYLIVDFTNDALKLNPQMHNQKKWVSEIKEASKGLPVIFMNSYHRASKYEFYSGNPSYSLNNMMSRKNQYSIRFEEDFLGKTIFLVYNYREKACDSIRVNNRWTTYKVIDNFISYSSIKLCPTTSLRYLEKDKDVAFKLSVINNYKSKPDFNINRDYPSYLSYQFFSNNKIVSNTVTSILLTNNMIDNDIDFLIHTPADAGDYVLNISIATGDLPPTINSDNIKVKVQ
jgi:hypothetical protein